MDLSWETFCDGEHSFWARRTLILSNNSHTLTELELELAREAKMASDG